MRQIKIYIIYKIQDFDFINYGSFFSHNFLNNIIFDKQYFNTKNYTSLIEEIVVLNRKRMLYLIITRTRKLSLFGKVAV